MKANLRDYIYLAIIILLTAYAHDRDYKALVKPQIEAQSCCPARNVLGAPLIASYCARSDSIQTKQCTYRRISA